MNTRITIGLAALLALAGVTSTGAQVPPQLLHYQGRVADNNGNFNGQGQFKFALVSGDGTVSYWSNDGQSGVNLEPTAQVQLTVDHGLFSVLLGDAGTVIPYTVFDNPDVRLRVWFRAANNNGPFNMFTPDQRIVSVGYAMRAANVVDGAITSAQIHPGAITGTNIANNSLSSSEIADILTLQTLNLGGISWDGALNLFAKPSGGGGLVNPSGAPRGVLLGDALGSEFGLYFSDGTTGATLSSRTTGGRLQLNDAAGNDTTVELSAGGNAGGFLTLRNPSGLSRAFLQGGGAHDGGELQLRDSTGANRLRLYGNAPGYIIDTPSAGGVDLYDLSGNRRIAMRGADGTIHLPQENGDEGVFLAGRVLGGSGGVVRARQSDGDSGVLISGQDGEGGGVTVYGATGQETIRLTGAETSTTGGQILLRQANRTNTIELDAEFGVGGGGILRLYRGNGQNTITLQADDAGGEGRITTQVLEITSGSDLSENFEIQTPDAQPGLIVSIDPAHPGELVLSARAYDRTVAGVVSGAGGVKPGLLMGQRGSKADGKHPVALTGRVYCFVDASQGAIEPGDLITTSDTPGHGMKVTDHTRAQGAIVGKAMTPLAAGRGLVLVLVTLQ